MKMRFFDFEVTPNWWLCVFGDMPENFEEVGEKVKDNFMIVSSDMPNSRDTLMQYIREKDYVLTGYNIKGYDLIIANAIYNAFTPQEVKIINDIIINPDRAWSTKEHMRLATFAKKRLRGICYQDLLDDSDGTLKEKEAILGLDIMESSVDFNKENLTEEDKADMTYYCKHDVYASMYFYNKIYKNYVNTKLAVGRKFNIPERECYMCTNANLVSKALGARRSSFTDEDKIQIELPDSIREYCYNNLPNKIIEQLCNSRDSFETTLFNNKVSFGNGGIHSVLCENIYVKSNDDWVLVNVDADSYYPSMLIKFKCLSRAVHDKQVFEDIFNERIAIKHKVNKTKEDKETQLALKLILNTTYGASGNKYLDLYDPYMCSKCCRLGQIFLAALANKLNNSIPNLRVIQTNTDGILIYCMRKYLPEVEKLQKEWTNVSGINMKLDYVDKIWQRNVNNYILVDTENKIKRKGAWLIDTYEKEGVVSIAPLTAFISQKAIINYLIDGTDIIKTIVGCTDFTQFVMTCKKGPSYRGVVQRDINGNETELFKCNRVYASTDSTLGEIYKYKMYKGNISYAKMPNIPEHCRLINYSFDTYKFEDIKKDLDYMFYIKRAIDLLGEEWYELCGTSIQPTNKFNYMG